MLAQERFEKILELLRKEQSVSVSDLTRQLNTSESTIRRDLTALDKQGLLIKVHGGATAVKSVFALEEAVTLKSKKNLDEKRKIAQYAADLVSSNDFVYIDAGTTTEFMIDYLKEQDVTYVTNGIGHARKLMNAGFHVILIGGEIKAVTEAVVGDDALENLEKYNFTKGFFGTNGIDGDRGLTTPDLKEASVKRKALSHCREVYILADHSKFHQISSVKFGNIEDTIIITDQLKNKDFYHLTTIKEVF
ncbi:DeoR family transcriptional regulator [Anaerostipes sp. 494a]|uniref:DeoR/GlpR family DNA-binding transcription regulator n=1 Tax=Anaerostipes sp. 494a TaxID=1261636 RepID=UPI000952B4BA|nr:DeoR/GlpR family DNA-binding transcription regulator [Anaerostipes sp. 494a]OLR59549.1 DeoR family transcriptional regulator [Anaerostipes sp. 494a]